MSDKTFPETSKKSQFVCIKSSLQFMHNKCIFKKFQDICCGTSHNGRQAPKVCAAKSEKHFQSSRKNSIHHFRIDHNAPCLSPTHSPPPPKILQNHCLGFLLRRLLHPEEIGNNGYAKFFLGGSGGVNKVLYGLCESSELYDPNIAALSRGCKNKPRTHHSPVFQFDWNRSYICLSICYRAFSVT